MKSILIGLAAVAIAAVSALALMYFMFCTGYAHGLC